VEDHLDGYKHYDEGSLTNYRKVSMRKFHSAFGRNTFAFDYGEGLQWLNANLSTNNPATIVHTMDSLTENGTWTAADNAENISLNERNYISGTGAIGIDLAAAGTTLTIVNSTISQIDTSEATHAFIWVYLPTTSNITQFNIRLGSDASNYASATATVPFNTSALQQGWNLIGFTTLTDTGSPNKTATDYVRLQITFSSTPSTRTGFIFDNVITTIGEPYELQYYSDNIWQNTGGTYLENSTSDSDTLTVTGEEYDLILSRLNYSLAQRIPLADTDIERFRRDYIERKRLEDSLEGVNNILQKPFLTDSDRKNFEKYMDVINNYSLSNINLGKYFSEESIQRIINLVK